MNREKMFGIWKVLYPETPEQILENFLQSVEIFRSSVEENAVTSDWYKDAVVYSLYVDLFNTDFVGLVNKLDYLKDLGVSCLWLLPVLDSPMRDAGFDISDYYNIRWDLIGHKGPDKQKLFMEFLREAHDRNIKVIFDVAMNHTSEAHPWFSEARKSTDNPYRNYYIWSRDVSKYKEARIIFKGIESSNWEACGDEYYFHRFFSYQPDLNYQNPEVLLAMSRVLLYWQQMGVDGFRADAIPYIWKDEGSDCENRPRTHMVVKFFRAILDYIKPGALLLAEACQKPSEVVAYLGQGDECHAAYHFPLMPRIFIALAKQNGSAIEETLSPQFTPPIPQNTQWFTFLRCHDELSLELVYVSEEERSFIHGNYCHDPSWDFRVGEGISARLAELFKKDPDRILLAFSIMLSLPGTPVIYYGDEFAKLNDHDYYSEMIQIAGKDDTRFLVRGRIDWNLTETLLADPASFNRRVYYRLREMIHARNGIKAFGRGTLEFVNAGNGFPGEILGYVRHYNDEHILILQNMTGEAVDPALEKIYRDGVELLGKPLNGPIEAFGFRWIKY